MSLIIVAMKFWTVTVTNPTTSSRKQFRPSATVFTSDCETSTEEEESSELESSDDKTSDVWCKTDKKPSTEPFLGTTGLNIVIDNPESVVEVEFNHRDYWSTDPTIFTPIFPHTVSRNRFESIWQAWNFSDNSQQTPASGRLFKIGPCMNILCRNLYQVTTQN